MFLATLRCAALHRNRAWGENGIAAPTELSSSAPLLLYSGTLAAKQGVTGFLQPVTEIPPQETECYKTFFKEASVISNRNSTCRK